MEEFKRGLDDAFVDLLNHNYGLPNSWWRKLVEDPDLFIGIRGNSLNVYYNGASLLALRRRGKHLVGNTHFKFLVREKPKTPYVSFHDGQFNDGDLSAIEFSRDIRSDLASIKAASKPYHGVEAVGVHQIIRSNYNVIDIEAVFRDERSRIDFAAFRPSKERPKLVFYEAKHFSNSELFGNRPKVVGQIERYRELLTNPRRAREIRTSYSRVAANFAHLNGFDPRFQALCQKVMTEGLEISPAVRLVVYGFDRAQKRDAKVLFDRLRNLIGDDFLLARGNPRGLVHGISQ